MFDAIKEWLSGLFGGASEHVDNAKQKLEDTNVADVQQQASDAMQSFGDQAGQVKDQAVDKATEVKDQFTKQ